LRPFLIARNHEGFFVKTESVHHALVKLSCRALTAVLLIGFATSAAVADTKVTFGTSGSLSDTSLSVAIAIDQGLYKKDGITPAVVDFGGGAPAVAALVGGGIQYCVCAPEHVVRLRNRGIDAVVAFALGIHEGYVLVGKDSWQGESLADLKGKRVGITSPGSKTDTIVHILLKRAGLVPDRDVEIVGIGGAVEQRAAIDGDRIVGGTITAPNAFPLLGHGYRAVYDWRDVPTASLALLALDKWQTANPDTARHVLQDTLYATKLLLADRDLRVAEIHKLFPKYDDVTVTALADAVPSGISHDGMFTPETFASLQDDLHVVEPELKPVDYSVANPGSYLK
jgi:NitT/TauT family transport system substrate-binding protein